MRWIKAKELQIGFIVLMGGHQIKVVGIDALLGDDNITIISEVGHNGVKHQRYNLKTWQEIQVLDEQHRV